MIVVSAILCLKWIVLLQPPWWAVALLLLFTWIICHFALRSRASACSNAVAAACTLALCTHVAHSVSIPAQWKTLVTTVTVISGISSPPSPASGWKLLALLGVVVVSAQTSLAVSPAAASDGKWDWLGLVTGCIWHVSCYYYKLKREPFDAICAVASAAALILLSAFPSAAARMWGSSTWWVLLVHPSISFAIASGYFPTKTRDLFFYTVAWGIGLAFLCDSSDTTLCCVQCLLLCLLLFYAESVDDAPLTLPRKILSFGDARRQ